MQRLDSIKCQYIQKKILSGLEIPTRPVARGYEKMERATVFFPFIALLAINKIDKVSWDTTQILNGAV